MEGQIQIFDVKSRGPTPLSLFQFETTTGFETIRGAGVLGAGGQHPGQGVVNEGGVRHRVRHRGQEDESPGQN